METCKKVLVFDDDFVNALYIKNILEFSGQYKITGIANNIGKAFSLFLESPPDLLISCISLKNIESAIDFINLTRGIKKVPVIYVSSLDDEETLDMTLDSSPEFYLTMPFTRKQLLVASRCAVQKSGLINGQDYT
ncbi:MAG: response regulator [Chlorobi bacterium]|nr:response regulator [Chlorobiota bacterium]